MAQHARFFGWQVVGACFVLALLAWGVGFYGPGVYLHALHEREGWSASLVSAAITLHFLASAALVTRLPALHRRFGPVAVTRAGALASALGVVCWAMAAAPWQLVPAALLTAIGWSTHSGAAINALLTPWFDRRRPAALSLAYNGASMGGVAFVPLWALLIAWFGFATAGVIVAAGLLLVIWPMAGRWFGATPEGLGLYPDGAATPPAPRRAAPDAGPLWRQPAFRSLSLSFALGLTAQIGLLATLFAILAPALGTAGAGLALSLATACAVAGRTAVGVLMPPALDRRLIGVANFGVQALGSVLLVLAEGEGVALLLAGVLLFGLGIGQLLSLPPLIAQQEWPPEAVGRVVALLTAVNQAFYAFGPALMGVALDAWGPAAPPLLALGLQMLAGGVLLAGRRDATARSA